MPRLNPLAIFSLVPLNDAAETALNKPWNEFNVSTITDPELSTNTLRGFEIGFHDIPSDDRTTLAILAYDSCDIRLGNYKERDQCILKIDESTGEIWILDKKDRGTTHLYYGPIAADIQLMPGTQFKSFKLEHRHGSRLVLGPQEDRQEYRIVWHTANNELKKIRYQYLPTMERIFEMYRKVNPHWEPKIVAVKKVSHTISLPAGGAASSRFRELHKMVDELSKRQYLNVIDYNGLIVSDDESQVVVTQAWFPNSFQLDQWNQTNPPEDTSLMFQLLNGLVFMHNHNIAHGNLFPQNILCIPDACGIVYKLTNYFPEFPQSYNYQAPEGSPTKKTDMWCLFGVMAETFDLAGFQGQPRDTPNQMVKTSQKVSSLAFFDSIRKMACERPQDRPRAWDMVVEVFKNPLPDDMDQLVLFKSGPSNLS